MCFGMSTAKRSICVYTFVCVFVRVHAHLLTERFKKRRRGGRDTSLNYVLGRLKSLYTSVYLFICSHSGN